MKTEDTNNEYKMEAANTGDGRLILDEKANGGAGQIYPEYHHKDHLGNTRVAFTDRNENGRVELLGPDAEVTQQLDYYPFGLQHEGEGLFHELGTPVNRYRYNGKEFSEELGLYDYGARWYDPAIGRWNAVDPLADRRSWVSPYNFVQNNPLLRIDPTGMLDDPVFNLKGEKIGDDGKNEGTIHIVTDKKKAKSLSGDNISLEGVAHVTLNGGKKTVEGVEASIVAAESDGIHEEGGHTEKTEDGVEIVPWTPGEAKVGSENGSVTPFDGTVDPGEDLLDNWHVHTSKPFYSDKDGVETGTFPQFGPSEPADTDFARGMTARGVTTIQVDTKGNGRVNFINGKGIIATMKTSNFLKLKE